MHGCACCRVVHIIIPSDRCKGRGHGLLVFYSALFPWLLPLGEPVVTIEKCRCGDTKGRLRLISPCPGRRKCRVTSVNATSGEPCLQHGLVHAGTKKIILWFFSLYSSVIANETNLLFFHICRLASFFRITVVVNKDTFFRSDI